MAIEQYKCRCAAICKGKIEDCVHPDKVHCVFDFPTGFDGENPTSGIRNGRIVDNGRYEKLLSDQDPNNPGGRYDPTNPYDPYSGAMNPNDPNYIGSNEYYEKLAQQASIILDSNRPKPKPNIIEMGWFDRDDDYHSEFDKYNVCGHVKKYDANIHVLRRKIR